MTTYRTINARREMRKATKIILLIVAGIFAMPILTGVIVGTVHAIHPTHSDTSVSDFNDGFADSKQDDCQQGFQPACNWLQGKG